MAETNGDIKLMRWETLSKRRFVSVSQRISLMSPFVSAMCFSPVEPDQDPCPLSGRLKLLHDSCPNAECTSILPNAECTSSETFGQVGNGFKRGPGSSELKLWL